MIYTILSCIALCIEALLIGFFVLKTVKNKKPFSKKTLWYAVPVFILVYCLYTIGYIYSGDKLTAFTILVLIPATLETFVFKVNMGMVSGLSQVNGCYYAAMVIALLLAGATLIASLIGLFGAKLSNAWKVKKSLKAGTEFVLGDSVSALFYAKNNGAVVLNFGGSDSAKKLIEKNVMVLSANRSLRNKFCERKLFGRKNANKSKEFHFIMFADGNFDYAQIIDWFIKQFSGIEGRYFTLHLETSIEEMDVINRKFIDVRKCRNICIKSFNKYELLSREFIMNYPISSYLPQNFYGELRTIKPEKKINVVCIGFGKVNYELMKIMIMQNQFVGLSEDGKKFVNHPVNYYVYDNTEDKIYCEMLQHIQTDGRRKSSSELPPPETICNITEVKKVNVYSAEFAKKTDSIFGDENAYSFVLVSIGSDYENMAYAEYLNATYGSKSIKVFARIRDNSTLKVADDVVSCFGYDRDILTRDVIINQSLDTLSREINQSYYGSSGNLEKEIESFNSIPTIERYSNIYHAISIFFKMGLLGLKFVCGEDAPDNDTLSKEELFAIYKGYSDKPDYNKYFELTVWNMLGFSEHSRWVAQYVLKGFQPMPLSEITVKKQGNDIELISKDIVARRHCCITDFYGLDIYHKFILKLYNENGSDKSINDVETYKYDYMFVNECYEFMSENGYKIIKQ